MSNLSSIKLELLKKNPADLYTYAKFILNYVKEVEKRSIKEEISKIQSEYHIDHYFITSEGKRIGVVKIYQGTYYYLGIKDKLTDDQITKVMELIEDNLGGWRINRIEATLHSQFKSAALKAGYKIEFARIKMELPLEMVKNLSDWNDIHIRTYERGDLKHLIDMASDAYRDSVDEQIGVFSGGMASSAISSILRGTFGDFKENLTPIHTNEGSDYIEGASMTTISEDCPFVVLIGVRRAEQGKGLGRKLLSWVIRKSEELGYKRIKLWVTEGNEKAIHLYKSLGFTEISRIYSLYKEF